VSPALITFLADWYHWATSGAPKQDVHEGGFSRRFGLCYHARKRGSYLADELGDLLINQFGYYADSPFDGDVGDYFVEAANERIHENPKRLAWVQKMLVSEL
jgi:hypothetical protein